jgi:WD40 repeat protein
LLDGGKLKELWSVGNQHGPVRAIVAGDLVVLGGQDGSVKQWSVDGDEPSYGTPFTRAGSQVAALALSAEHILAATVQGEVAEWTLATAQPLRTTTIPDMVLAALALSGDAATVVTGADTGQLFAVTRATGAKMQLTSTLWGVHAASYAPGNRLYTAGHWYGQPQLERRIADSPIEAPDVWRDDSRGGHVTAIATDAQAKVVVAGGHGFVATFAADAIAAGPTAIKDVDGHGVTGTVVLPGGAVFITAGNDGTLRAWKTEGAEAAGSLAVASPIGVAVDTAGTRLFTSGDDGRLHAFGCE